MKRRYLALLIAPLFCASVSAAGYVGPGSVGQTTTAAAANDAADDTPVVLQGYIVKRLKKETYEFKDATGVINVEIDDEDWPAQVAVDDKRQVRLIGEVDRGIMGREVDVDRVELMN
ncbi:YgiW/YdeI family stress tolerance OB fold protein [Pseudomonas sp. nanlin1]|uniref:YgiW/YdeI family stress tolerance OB fold protein n=1 Tax=Pseudomonas sp. nanlin1 TaxID=3040605 RepID=UPI00388F80F1